MRRRKHPEASIRVEETLIESRRLSLQLIETELSGALTLVDFAIAEWRGGHHDTSQRLMRKALIAKEEAERRIVTAETEGQDMSTIREKLKHVVTAIKDAPQNAKLQ